MTARAPGTLANRLLSPFAQLREGEATTALLMFAYSFLAMTAYNIIKPVTRGLFISKLGPDNLPWVQFGAGVAIGLIMQVYTRVIAIVPRRWMIPVTQAGMVGLLVVFYLLFMSFPTAKPIAAGFYVYGLILGILLTSQFWTLANDVYDARQAKRLFGLIGAGSTLGAASGSGLTFAIVERIGVNQMLLASAAALALCGGIVIAVLRREHAAGQSDASKTGEESGVGAAEAFRLLTSSRHLQTIALIIAFGAIGAALVEQQLNMAAAAAKGATNEGAVTAFLAQVTVYLSLIAFVIQAGLTSRIHRLLGIGFAMLILPVSLGITGTLMLLNGALWTASAARIVDTSLRYTVDKTTREILFLPLPLDLKYRAKPFIDVTVDRFAKGLGALLILVLIKDWGMGFTWQQLSYASLTMMVLWMMFALRARREYLRAFRRSIEQQDLEPSEIRLDTADLNTIETLLLELSHPEPRRVLYAIDLLESLDKRHLVTPLLLYHESAEVRARALQSAASAPPALADLWARGAERALKDADYNVRLAAVRALAALRREQAIELMRPLLRDADWRLAITAATAMASSSLDSDRAAAEALLRELASDTREQSIATRVEVARALGELNDPRFRELLVPLMFDASLEVAREAIQSAGRLPAGNFIFVPPLISLMRHRLLKPAARAVLVGYGDDVIKPLAYFLNDQDEDVWIRRHVPSTLGMLPSQASLDVLLGALGDNDGFVRYKALAAIDRIRTAKPDLTLDRVIIERQILAETTRSFNALTLHYNLFVVGALDSDMLLARVLQEKAGRARNRIFRLLGLLHPPSDIAAVRSALAQPDARLRSGAVEYLDNLLAGDIRRRVMLLLDEMPEAERMRKGNALFKTRVRDVEDTLAQLIHDDEQVIAASAIQVVERRQLWALADDLEHVLARRDARDWAVFEAASWALAARTLSNERRRALWLEPLPAVELADRLRRIPLFNFVSVDELFRIAGLGRQVRHESGRVLYESGRVPESLQVLLDGRVRSERPEGAETTEAPAVLAFEHVVEGSPMESTIRAADTTISLELGSEQFLSLLSENVEVAEGMFRLLIETGGTYFGAAASSGEHLQWDRVLPGGLSPELERRIADGLQPVELVLLLQASPLFARATSAQLVALAAIARPVALKPGIDPVAGAEPSILVVLSGSVRVEREGHAPETADAGDMIGVPETLGGMPLTTRVEVVSAGRGLRFLRPELFEVLADNIDLLQGLFSGLLRARPERLHA